MLSPSTGFLIARTLSHLWLGVLVLLGHLTTGDLVAT